MWTLGQSDMSALLSESYLPSWIIKKKAAGKQSVSKYVTEHKAWPERSGAFSFHPAHHVLVGGLHFNKVSEGWGIIRRKRP